MAHTSTDLVAELRAEAKTWRERATEFEARIERALSIDTHYMHPEARRILRGEKEA